MDTDQIAACPHCGFGSDGEVSEWQWSDTLNCIRCGAHPTQPPASGLTVKKPHLVIKDGE